ncbi:MAG: ATP-binding protein [Acidobacteriota bacterium]
MKLRHRFILYVAVLHLGLAALAVPLLLEDRVWLLAVEALILMSLFLGYTLYRSVFGTLSVIQTGAQFLQEQDFSTRIVPVGQPEMDQLVALYNRMIDQLRDERVRLQEQHHFLNKVLAASPSGIVTFDLDRRISMMNPAAARILQRSEQELRGLMLAEVRTPFANELHQLKVGESRLIPLGGRRRLKCQKSHFLDRGFPREFVLLEELTEELRQTEKAAYEKLIRMMSHEVNNTVAATNSLLHSCRHYAGQLKDEDREDYEKALQVVIGRAEELNDFMKGFAEVARVPNPCRHPCDLRELLMQIQRLLDSELAQRRISWQWDIQADPGPVMLDRGQMEQALVNILRNSIEAIEYAGTITARIGSSAGVPFVLIEDTGSGIRPEDAERLFTPFFSTKQNGQGIGLTLVREILDGHGFDYALDSAPDCPTRFSISFATPTHQRLAPTS